MNHLTIFLWVSPIFFYEVEINSGLLVLVDAALFRVETPGPESRSHCFKMFLRPVAIAGCGMTLTHGTGRTITGLV